MADALKTTTINRSTSVAQSAMVSSSKIMDGLLYGITTFLATDLVSSLEQMTITASAYGERLDSPHVRTQLWSGTPPTLAVLWCGKQSSVTASPVVVGRKELSKSTTNRSGDPAIRHVAFHVKSAMSNLSAL